MRFLLIILLFIFSPLSLSEEHIAINEKTAEHLQKCFSVIEPFEAQYEMNARFITAESTHSLEKRGQGWRYQSEASKSFVGRISETSRFSVEDGFFKLNQYDSYRRLGFNKNERTIEADWDNRILQVSDRDNKSFKHEILFDKASQQLAIQCLVRAGFYSFEIPVIDRNGSRMRGYKVESIDKIETPFAEHEAIKIKEVRDDSREIVFWLDPEIDFLPAKFIYYENGDEEFSAVLTDYKK